MTSPCAWTLAGLPVVDSAAPRVVSTFCCGGGSSQGYKRAGFRVIGANDIDPKMIHQYSLNFPDTEAVCAPIDDLPTRDDLMEKWQDIDLLDGSPPCTVFSVTGKREEFWGVKKKFTEGQADQVLDTLFLSYLQVVDRCRPKVFLAENVEGMARGNARGYVREVITQARTLGYRVTVVRAKAGWYGVPQIRGRLFFVGVREDVSTAQFTLPAPTAEPVTVRQAFEGLSVPEEEKSWMDESSQAFAKWSVNPGGGYGFSRNGQRMHQGFFARLSDDWTPKAIETTSQISHPHEPRWLHPREFSRLATFADDYQFVEDRPAYAQYVTGMSVPPFLMEAVAAQVRKMYL